MAAGRVLYNSPVANSRCPGSCTVSIAALVGQVWRSRQPRQSPRDCPIRVGTEIFSVPVGRRRLLDDLQSFGPRRYLKSSFGPPIWARASKNRTASQKTLLLKTTQGIAAIPAVPSWSKKTETLRRTLTWARALPCAASGECILGPTVHCINWRKGGSFDRTRTRAHFCAQKPSRAEQGPVRAHATRARTEFSST